MDVNTHLVFIVVLSNILHWYFGCDSSYSEVEWNIKTFEKESMEKNLCVQEQER